jgi:hypothetical protein
MPPAVYPDLTWSGRFNRTIRTLQVIAVAGTIGAIGGAVAVLALVGPNSDSTPRQIRTGDFQPIRTAPAPQAPARQAAAETIAGGLDATSSGPIVSTAAAIKPNGGLAAVTPPQVSHSAQTRTAHPPKTAAQLYDRSNDSAGEYGTTKRFFASPAEPQVQPKRKPGRRPTVAAMPPALPPQAAPRVIVLPPRGPDYGDEGRGGWQGGFNRDWGGGGSNWSGNSWRD